MIPDKAGYWWMLAEDENGTTRKFIADVIIYDGQPMHFCHGCVEPMPCDIPDIEWLGPVVDPFADVVEFHRAMFPHLIGDKPAILPTPEIKKLRTDLIFEEWRELTVAIYKDDLVEIIDGALDLIYVTFGLLCTCGINPWPIWQVIHISNMAKVDGPISESGKKLKPPGWQPPDIAGELEKQGYVEPQP